MGGERSRWEGSRRVWQLRMGRAITSRVRRHKTAHCETMDARIEWWDTPVVTAGAIVALGTIGTMLWRNRRKDEGRELPVGWNENDYFSDMVSTLSTAQLKKTIANYGLPQNLIESQAHYIHNNGSDDWVFSAMEDKKLLNEKGIYMWDKENLTAYAVHALGRNVCGHPKLVHGGISALIIDNVAGYAIFKLKAANAVPAGPAFTVNLNVNYRKPIPSMSAVICSVKLQSHERKKSLLEIKLYSPPDEHGDNLTYCEATALMVTPSAGQTTGA